MLSTSLELSLGDILVITQWLSLILPHMGIEPWIYLHMANLHIAFSLHACNISGLFKFWLICTIRISKYNYVQSKLCY